MTTDELLEALPKFVGNNPNRDNDGNITGYLIQDKFDDIQWLKLSNDGTHWIASYGTQGFYLCLNPKSTEPPYNNAVTYGDTPNEALTLLYEWCVENGFI